MCKVLKMIVISVVRFQKYYVIFKLLRNYWKGTTHFNQYLNIEKLWINKFYSINLYQCEFEFKQPHSGKQMRSFKIHNGGPNFRSNFENQYFYEYANLHIKFAYLLN